MRATMYESKMDRGLIVSVIIGDQELEDGTKSNAIILEVRQIVAQKIADKIMEQIGPLVDEALAGFGSREETSPGNVLPDMQR